MNAQSIRAMRKTLGLTQAQLAERIAATQVTVARWETGVSTPKGAYLKALQELEAAATKEVEKIIGETIRGYGLTTEQTQNKPKKGGKKGDRKV
jgi:Predicted transcriptional regulator